MEVAARLLAGALAAMFLAASFGKWNSRARWVLTTTSLFPTRLRFGRIVRWTVPAAEAGVAVLILAWPVLGLASAAGLMLVFAAGVLWLSADQAGEECGCFGALMPSRVGAGLAWRDAILALVAAATAIAAARIGLSAFGAVELMLLFVVGVNIALGAELWRMPRQTLRGASEMRSEA